MADRLTTGSAQLPLLTESADCLKVSGIRIATLIILSLLAIWCLDKTGYHPYAVHDNAHYVASGRLYTRGLIPYRDLFDHHPPGIYAITTLAWLISPSHGHVVATGLFSGMLCAA